MLWKPLALAPTTGGGICKHIVAVMLAVLRQAETEQAVQQKVQTETVETDSLKPLLDALSAEQLRAFIGMQAAEFPPLVNNLQIFSAGSTETAKKVEDYATEIEAALKAANIVDPSER
jgi:uncharacterized Zn finger protein